MILMPLNDRHLVSFLKQKSVESSYPVTKDSFEKIKKTLKPAFFAMPSAIPRLNPRSSDRYNQVHGGNGSEWPNKENYGANSFHHSIHHSRRRNNRRKVGGVRISRRPGYSNFIWYYENMQRVHRRILKIHPIIKDSYRFFIDTWCLQNITPHGDTGAFAQPIPNTPYYTTPKTITSILFRPKH